MVIDGVFLGEIFEDWYLVLSMWFDNERKEALDINRRLKRLICIW